MLSIPAPRPAKPQQTLEVEFNTGEHFSLPAEYLRVESPAAGNLDARDAFGRLKASTRQRQPIAYICAHVQIGAEAAAAQKPVISTCCPCVPALKGASSYPLAARWCMVGGM